MKSKHIHDDSFAGKEFITGILTGAAFGLVAGILLAPRSGRETIEKISGIAEEQKSKLNDQWEQTKDKAREAVDSVKNKINSSADLLEQKEEFYADIVEQKTNQIADDIHNAAHINKSNV